MTYGLLHVVSLVLLTAVVAVVLGVHEDDTPGREAKHVRGCWVKILGTLIGLGVVVYILSLFAG